MARKPTLSYDRGTLILHPPPRGKEWLDYATWDDRIERFRVPASQYRSLVLGLRAAEIEVIDNAKGFQEIELVFSSQHPNNYDPSKLNRAFSISMLILAMYSVPEGMRFYMIPLTGGESSWSSGRHWSRNICVQTEIPAGQV